jgi:hypothetical protein
MSGTTGEAVQTVFMLPYSFVSLMLRVNKQTSIYNKNVFKLDFYYQYIFTELVNLGFLWNERKKEGMNPIYLFYPWTLRLP